MKLLLISILLAILHIQFYKMEPNPKDCFSYLSDDSNSSDGASCRQNLFKSTKMGDIKPERTATEIANDAAEVAKAANEALAAAAQNASYQVQMLLADRAMAAANTANSLVVAKQAIVDSYAKEIKQTEAVVAQIRGSLETSQANANATCAALKMAKNHKVALQILMTEIRSGLEDLDFLADQVKVYLEQQKQMVAKAQKRGDRLSKQFAKAKAEFEEMRVSTCKAVAAAEEANLKLICVERPSPGNRSRSESMKKSPSVHAGQGIDL